MKQILVPIDFSKNSKNALALAGFIAKKFSAELTVLHIITPSRLLFANQGTFDKGIEKEYLDHVTDVVKTHLNKLLKDENLNGVNTNIKIVQGGILKSIQEHSQSLETDLLVMGTRGVSGLDEFLIGSRTERVVRHANIPVLVVREKPENFKFENVIFATDFNPKHASVLEHLQIFQEVFNAKVHLLYINTSSNFTSSQDIEGKAQKLIEEVELKNYQLHIEAAYNAENGIMAYAKKIDADLVTIATNQRTGLRRYFSGSIAEDLVNHTRRPLLTFGLKNL